MTTRPASKPSAAASTWAAAEAKAGEGLCSVAPETLPAPGGTPTTRPESTSPAAGTDRPAAGTKVGEEPRRTGAPATRPAPGESAGPKATPSSAFGPAWAFTAPTARVTLPAGAPEADWHAVRATGVGGSDVAAILGMDRYRGPLHVWQAKCGDVREDRDVRLDRAARRGHRLEGLVAEFFAEDSGCTVVETPGTLQHTDHPHWLANLDRVAFRPGDDDWSDPAVLECKSRTWRSARTEGWSGDEAPDGPSLQAHWYLTVTGYQHAYVAGLIDDDLTWFRLTRDEELCGLLADTVDRFWHDHVIAGIPPRPDGSEATTKLLARLWDAREEAAVEVDPVETMLLKQRRRELKEQLAELGDDLTEVENLMRALAEDAEVATIGGRTAFTWRQNGNFAPARFAKAEPELAAEYTHLVPVVDTKRLAADHPLTYRKYRARVLRTPQEG